jgi:hypothetical protein
METCIMSIFVWKTYKYSTNFLFLLLSINFMTFSDGFTVLLQIVHGLILKKRLKNLEIVCQTEWMLYYLLYWMLYLLFNIECLTIY